MAETDIPRPSASGASRADGTGAVGDDRAAAADAGIPGGAPDRVEEPAPAVARQDELPMREAAVLPEVPEVPDAGGDEELAGESSVDEFDEFDAVDEVDDADAAQAEDTERQNDAAQAEDTERPSGDRDFAHGPAGAQAASAVPAGRASSSAGSSSTGPSPAHGSHTPAAADPSTDTAALSVPPSDSEAARRAAARDNAATAKPALPRFLQVVVALFFPIIVVAAAIRAVATSSFLWLEYHRPGFPADRFGFSLDDRMTYGSYALDYVLNFAPPRYLGDLVTPEGEPLFLESEVGHMADVKGVLGLSFFLALVLFVLSVLACIYLARRYKGGVRRALFSGAVLTLVGIAVLTVLAVLAWETFFTQVHAVFFADGTWTFRLDDTLIRLFPEQFWTDSAVTVAALVLTATILTLVLTWPTKARRNRSRRAQEAAQERYRKALDAS
ncbi:TIGR01906 family membrane protein [Arthrobacter pityocampae]|uniref:TIGR01906 family membrane protein n=1 Tax=Arthrobacter pityocampae TaxID=547334 RepID=UPI00373655AB